jgi:hypothetical protein
VGPTTVDSSVFPIPTPLCRVSHSHTFSAAVSSDRRVPQPWPLLCFPIPTPLCRVSHSHTFSVSLRVYDQILPKKSYLCGVTAMTNQDYTSCIHTATYKHVCTQLSGRCGTKFSLQIRSTRVLRGPSACYGPDQGPSACYGPDQGPVS